MDYGKLRELREAKRPKITLEAMAERVGTTAAYLSMVERNKREPTNKLIEDLCRELGCKLSIIIDTDA